jgi:pilus assembly protein Flp/PilA
MDTRAESGTPARGVRSGREASVTDSRPPGAKDAERSYKVGRTMTEIKRLLRSEDGPTTVEYAVMFALILIAAMAAITALGNQMVVVFEHDYNALPE